MSRTIGLLVSAVMLLASIFQSGSLMGQTQVELGQVKWNRDLDAAKKLSLETGKPLFVQFQEVPG